jgi:hypothetical protein
VTDLADALKTLADDQDRSWAQLLERVRALEEEKAALVKALELAAGHLEEQLDCKRCHPVGLCPVLDELRAALALAKGTPR